ncbi:HU family DNA-binding protein [Thioclava sp. DLFJ5-1]|uniref:HU family DNA-binding protein n=1 Tax=Thioclava sp. DLFJ5-1 TaxID=1915314 RepID=UPI000996B2DF|nr:HU family DNA-binding protein [Thioclava sp. DLFJ5-1]
MKKQDLIDAIAERTGMTKTNAERALDALKSEATLCMATGKEFEISGLVRITPKLRPARQGRNPKTGESLEIPARYHAATKALPALLRALPDVEGRA